MKAIECVQYGLPSKLVIGEKGLKPKKGEVLVQVKACGVNFPDTLIIQGLYQFKPEIPFTPGSDIAGIVKELGEGVTEWKVGDEVVGIVMHGGFAEEAIVPSKSLFPKPQNMNFEIAASFMMAYGTSYYALKQRGKLISGESLLVLGAAGGVGIAAVELGKQMGAHVIAAASSDEKLALCREKGADETINYSKENLRDRIKELTNNNGIDVVYDPVGGELSELAVRSLAWNGRYLVIGFVAGIPKLPLNLPLLKGASIVGVFWGSHVFREPKENRINMKELMEMYHKGRLAPYIDKIYSLEETPKALEDLMNRKVKGKIVIVP